MVSPLHTLRWDRDLVTLLANRAPYWVAAVLIVLLGARVAYVVTDYFGAGARTAAPSGGAIAPPVAAARLDLAGLIGANLFGSAAPAAQDGPAPVTTMSLVLVGVMASGDPQRGVAVLGPTAAAAKVYLVGSTVPGGARLHAVYGDRVLLDRGGSIEALLLPQRSPPTGAPPPPVAVAQPLGDRLQQLAQNPGIVPNVLRPQVVLLDGRQRGFRVFPGPNRAAFNKLGLRPGDLVTAINGTSLDDPALGQTVFQSLSSTPSAKVTVTRDGRQQDVMINVAQAVAEAEKIGSEPAPAAAAVDPTVPPP